MSECPENYKLLCELCIPIDYPLSDADIEILKRKLVGAVIMLLPDNVTRDTLLRNGQPVARP